MGLIGALFWCFPPSCEPTLADQPCQPCQRHGNNHKQTTSQHPSLEHPLQAALRTSHKLDDLYRAMPPKRDEVQVGDEKWKAARAALSLGGTGGAETGPKGCGERRAKGLMFREKGLVTFYGLS